MLDCYLLIDLFHYQYRVAAAAVGARLVADLGGGMGERGPQV